MRAALCLLFFSLPLFAQNLEVVTPKKKMTFTLDQLKAKLKSQTVKIDDPVYGKTKEYDAFLLQDVLQLAGLTGKDKADELVLTAADGYSPNVTFAKVKEHKGYLAYQEHATPGRFALVAQGKAMISPWPFYLVWEEGTALKDQVPWPYQLVKLELVDWAQKYPQVIPHNAASGSAEMKGFALFKAECIRCHSVNLQGGDLGPELNVPQNITEYWKPDVLKSYIQNVAAFRAKSKMPAFTRLTDDELNQILAYLKSMAAYKIKTL
jgi:mono/diheme cytochrome c family protein